MKNLFIVHTPYHLILATGIQCKDKSCESDIIIYKDFDLSNTNLESLACIFKNIYIYDKEDYKKFNIPVVKSIIMFKSKIENIKKLLGNKRYDKIFVFNEAFVETQYIINKNKISDDSKVIYVEDGANAYMSLGFKEKESQLIVKIKSLITGIKYEDISFECGTHSKIKQRMVTWPQILKKELVEDGKEIIEIESEIIHNGLTVLYKKFIDNIDEKEDKILILLEHKEFFDMYKEADLKLYIDTIQLILSNLESANVYVKYHPRDESDYLNDIFKNFKNITFMNKNVPAEAYCLSEQSYVISVFSTTLLTVAKLISPKNAISISDIMNMELNTLRENFVKLGITIPADKEDLRNILNQSLKL